ncbi:MAG: hypothetical protein MJ195_02865 [Mycoplasmoidaceae bacterium]|nr:hypothetical protein [Mycoplasmoidaceae bacterium]
MKKTKLLMPILGVTATLGAVVPTVVACGPKAEETPIIDDSAVVRSVASQDIEGKIGFVFTGFKYNGEEEEMNLLESKAHTDAP